MCASTTGICQPPRQQSRTGEFSCRRSEIPDPSRRGITLPQLRFLVGLVEKALSLPLWCVHGNVQHRPRLVDPKSHGNRTSRDFQSIRTSFGLVAVVALHRIGIGSAMTKTQHLLGPYSSTGRFSPSPMTERTIRARIRMHSIASTIPFAKSVNRTSGLTLTSREHEGLVLKLGFTGLLGRAFRVLR